MGIRSTSRRARTRKALGTGLVTGVAALVTIASSGVGASVAPRSSGPVVTLNGAGSTFDQPFFTRAFYVYHQMKANITINYASIGSGGGEQQFESHTVNFGASDVPMLTADLAKVPASAGPVIQVPVALGGEAIAYNLPGVATGLHITPSVLASIFLGQIKNWDDSPIAALNPKAHLPNEAITVVHRADSSGTTYIFTNYLADVSPTWSSQIGIAKAVQWPVGIGGQGNEGVAGAIQQTPGAIGYVELAYVLQAKMTVFALQNPKGVYVMPTRKSVAADAALHPHVSATNFAITNLGGSTTSYPISGYSWALIYQNQSSATTGSALVDLLYWLSQGNGGQKAAGALGYVPLPNNVQQLATTELEKVVGPSGKLLPSGAALAKLLK